VSSQLFHSTRIEIKPIMGLNDLLKGKTSDISSRLQILLTLIIFVLVLTLEGHTSMSLSDDYPRTSLFSLNIQNCSLYIKCFKITSSHAQYKGKGNVSVTLKRKLVCISASGHFSLNNFGYCLRQSTSILAES
jgi:hypothetical protein